MITLEKHKLQKRIKRLIIFFIVATVLSGITAFPIEWQLSLASAWIHEWQWNNGLTQWLKLVHQGVTETNIKYPFIFYGTDWLAFAHLVIAVAFIGPLRDPVRNIWVIEFGMLACLGVFPLAFIAGAVRGIPLYWSLIDCLFGVGGGLVLWRCHRYISSYAKLTPHI